MSISNIPFSVQFEVSEIKVSTFTTRSLFTRQSAYNDTYKVGSLVSAPLAVCERRVINQSMSKFQFNILMTVEYRKLENGIQFSIWPICLGWEESAMRIPP